MSTTAKTIVLIILLGLIGSIAYTYVLSTSRGTGLTGTTTPDTVATTGPDAAAATTTQTIATSTPDGEYYAYVKEAKLSFTSVTLTLEHVTYFTGAEARVSAQHDVACPSGNIDACVPTLAKGYYVRESGAPWFNVNATLATKLSLSTTTEAILRKNPTLSALGDYKPVVLVILKNGQAAEIREVTKGD